MIELKDPTSAIAQGTLYNAGVTSSESAKRTAFLPDATIEWSNFASGGDVVQAFGAGSLDIGLAGSSPATKALSAPLDLPVKVIWIHDVKKPRAFGGECSAI